MNQALVDEGDNRLCAEVHRYQSLMDEVDRKERELSTLQDHLMDITVTWTYTRTCYALLEPKQSSSSKTGGLEQGKVSLSICHDPSHGGSYMAEGAFYIRIGLPPRVVLGDCLASSRLWTDFSPPSLLPRISDVS